ncbi:DJ-1/PfpI family protein [Nonomuraea sp. NBC_00507]|uniref:DJ-1/PfpI family protein n=1 Tax=Nonomuraea sp. NBC_00507 TaxID=2976002 RepID=UPI002E180F87
MAAPTTRAVKLVVHDFEPGWDAYTEKPGHQLPVDLAFADVHPEEYQALVIPGGRAPEYIRTDPDVARIVYYFFERGLPVGTICHGPQVPAALGLLRGRTTAAFPPSRTDMEMAGAMVSCRGWPDLPEWSRAFMRVLEGANVSL